MSEIIQATDWRFTSPQEGEVDSVEQKQKTLKEIDDALVDPGVKAQLESRGSVPVDFTDRSGRTVPGVTTPSSPYYDSTFVYDAYQDAYVTDLHKHPTPAHVPAADTLDPGVDIVTSGGTYRLTGAKSGSSAQKITISRVARADVATKADKLDPGFKVKTSAGTVSSNGTGTIEIKRVALADAASKLAPGFKIKTLGGTYSSDGTGVINITRVNSAKDADLAQDAVHAKRSDSAAVADRLNGFYIDDVFVDGSKNVSIKGIQVDYAARAGRADTADTADAARRLNPGFKIDGIAVDGTRNVSIKGIKVNAATRADKASSLEPGFTIVTAGGNIKCNGTGSIEIKKVAQAVKSDSTAWADNADYAHTATHFTTELEAATGRIVGTAQINGYPFSGDALIDAVVAKRSEYNIMPGKRKGLWLKIHDIPGGNAVFFGKTEPEDYFGNLMTPIPWGVKDGDIYVMID